jgi:hypothetical protein
MNIFPTKLAGAAGNETRGDRIRGFLLKVVLLTRRRPLPTLSDPLSEMQCAPAPSTLLSECGSHHYCCGVKIADPQSGTSLVLLVHHNQHKPRSR